MGTMFWSMNLEIKNKLDELSNIFVIIVYKHRYILKLINRYEIESIKKGKNHWYLGLVVNLVDCFSSCNCETLINNFNFCFWSIARLQIWLFWSCTENGRTQWTIWHQSQMTIWIEFANCSFVISILLSCSIISSHLVP